MKYLADGNGVLIFDGLDEITIADNVPDALDKRREQLQNLMESISRQFPQCKIIVTSRPAGYSDWTLKNFDTVRVLPVTEAESKAIITSLFKSIGIKNGELENKTLFLVNHLKRVPKNLREQPLFIVLLVKLYYENKNQELPVERGALLKHSVQLLLSSWFAKRNTKESLMDRLGCSEQQLTDVLEIVAKKSLETEVHLNSPDDQYVSRSLILDELYEVGLSNHKEILNFISEKAGILNSPSQRNFKFAHRMFQEYLAASYLAKTENPIQFLEKSLISSFQTWKEVTLLIADIFRAANDITLWELIETLSSSSLDKLVWLSSLIIVEQNVAINERKVIMTITNQVRENLLAFLEKQDISTKDRVDILIALDRLNDTRPGVGLQEDGLPDIRWINVPVGKHMIGLTSAQADILQKHGAADWQFVREFPSFESTNQAFQIACYPVTVKQFSAFRNADDGYFNDEWWTGEGLSWRDRNSPPLSNELPGNCPQNYVTWFEAAAFCNWLGYKLNAFIRLPTEIEWEICAKITTDSMFPWGEEFLSGTANVRSAGFNKIIPVGAFFDSQKEIPRDLIGNIWEWCSTIVEKRGDGFYKYPPVDNDGRESLSGGDRAMRATRGGYYSSDLLLARSSYRGRDIPSSKLARQGFRILREL